MILIKIKKNPAKIMRNIKNLMRSRMKILSMKVWLQI